MTVDLEEEQDPPAFLAARKRDKERLQKVSGTQRERAISVLDLLNGDRLLKLSVLVLSSVEATTIRVSIRQAKDGNPWHIVSVPPIDMK